jgi:STE24 endopeptidase
MSPLAIALLNVLFALALIDALVDFLNWRRLPSEPARMSLYQLEHLRLDLAETGVQLLFWLVAFQLPLLDRMDEWLGRFIASDLWRGAAWLAAVNLLRQSLSLPFAWHATFSIEARYGFNRTTHSTFLLDRVKGLVLGLAIGIPLIAMVLHFFASFGSHAWWMAWVAVTGISLFLGYIAPIVFLPLFNRFKPLPEGELKQAIEQYAHREHFAMKGTFVMDGSKRSSKRNAFFTGFGRFRKLVLFDTLIEKHTTDELMAIVAHEMGHFKLGHIPRMIALSTVTQGLIFWGVGLFFVHPDSQEWVRTTLLLPESTLAASLLLLTLLYAPVGRALSLLSLWISRRHEFEADRYSSDTFGKPAALISALRALERDHLSHPDPHPLKVWMDYSHPPVARRARALGVPET